MSAEKNPATEALLDAAIGIDGIIWQAEEGGFPLPDDVIDLLREAEALCNEARGEAAS